MKDSNMAIPPLVPGLAHSGTATVWSTGREARVLSQSTGCEVKVGEKRKKKKSAEVIADSDELQYTLVLYRTSNIKSGEVVSLSPCSD